MFKASPFAKKKKDKINTRLKSRAIRTQRARVRSTHALQLKHELLPAALGLGRDQRPLLLAFPPQLPHSQPLLLQTLALLRPPRPAGKETKGLRRACSSCPRSLFPESQLDSISCLCGRIVSGRVAVLAPPRQSRDMNRKRKDEEMRPRGCLKAQQKTNPIQSNPIIPLQQSVGFRAGGFLPPSIKNVHSMSPFARNKGNDR